MDIFYPLKILSDYLTYRVFTIPANTHLAEALNFFIYDTIKILLMLGVIIFVVSIIRSFLPPERIKSVLSHKKTYLGNALAALFGVITPFCTCSAIPLFLGFIEAGVPLGITFSFLIASPMVNEVALIMLWGMFGAKVALIYIVSGLSIAICSGIIIGKLKIERMITHINYNKGLVNPVFTGIKWSWKDRVICARDYTFLIIKNVWVYVVLGIAIGAWIHGFVPSELIAKYAGGDKWYAVPLSVIVGIPLYSNAAGVIPLVSALTEKGVMIGTALAFMMAVTGLSLPEFLILKRVMRIKLLLIFAAIVGIGIIFTGYLFNFILK